jgi:GxxExxY protein
MNEPRIDANQEERNIGICVAELFVSSIIKAAQAIDAAHKAQILNYLRVTEFEVGLLLNFGPKPQFHRFVFENNRKGLCGDSRSFAAKQ